MKIFRILIGIILAIVFALSCCFTMGSMALDNALSDKAVEKAIVETGAVDTLTDSIIGQNTVNMGGRYGETMQAIMKSDAMTAFFAEYTASCLRANVYNEPVEEIANDEFYQAFSKGMDECAAEGTMGMSETERLIFDKAVQTTMPMLTAGVNAVLTQLDITEFVDEDTEAQIKVFQILASEKVKTIAMVIALISAALLLVVFWRKKMGFIWIAVILLLISVLSELLALQFYSFSEEVSDSLALSTQMLGVMLSYGLQTMAVIGGITGLALFPVRAIIKRIL